MVNSLAVLDCSFFMFTIIFKSNTINHKHLSTEFLCVETTKSPHGALLAPAMLNLYKKMYICMWHDENVLFWILGVDYWLTVKTNDIYHVVDVLKISIYGIIRELEHSTVDPTIWSYGPMRLQPGETTFTFTYTVGSCYLLNLCFDNHRDQPFNLRLSFEYIIVDII